jgi:hypothetical protein
MRFMTYERGGFELIALHFAEACKGAKVQRTILPSWRVLPPTEPTSLRWTHRFLGPNGCEPSGLTAPHVTGLVSIRRASSSEIASRKGGRISFSNPNGHIINVNWHRNRIKNKVKWQRYEAKR